jgi:hypothetical protein
VTLTEDVRLPQAIKRSLVRAQRERARAAEKQASASTSAREAAHALVDEGHSPLRDAAALLGLSHQRVQQLLAS